MFEAFSMRLRTDRKFRRWSIIGWVILVILLTAGSCDTPQDHPTPTQASTNYTFVDISDAGLCTYVYYNSKDATTQCTKSSPVSFWYDPNDTQNRLIGCTHRLDKSSFMSQFSVCNYYLPPVQVPPDARLAGFNVGAQQVAESVWSTSQGYMLCQHQNSLLNFTQLKADSCSNFAIPKELSSQAILSSINSGYHVESSEMWKDKGSYWQCDTDPVYRPDGLIQPFVSQNRVKFCRPYILPSADMLPPGAGDLKGVKLNADLDNAWEFYFTATYNGKGNYIVRCIYNYSDPSDTSDPYWEETFTDVRSCDWWFGLKSDLMPVASRLPWEVQAIAPTIFTLNKPTRKFGITNMAA